ncbi:hypothetical protein ASE36_10080 [Rhizobium sp. Root274]|uniref:hypothetical protein n=1 Tax=unclassified Rhizobium TaxID=2613769 RepID=UPI000715F820|nr:MULTISPECIES: hypothetical protein [unclassified Rhizobium]KQW28831.1 hypothetical protein ASC71_10095 [Rhizobium sp. Root1240]KRD29028.1 hypothetical protein ASE36_10080 [Rhizobium sp. Root274]
MNSAVKLALAGAMTIASASGAALAQTTDPMVDTTATTASTMSDDVTVVLMTSLNDESTREKFTKIQRLSKSETAMAEAQAELQKDPGLTAALTAQNVQLENVVLVETAANGGKTVYLK